jgi:cation diffusion facilitator family transporter
MLFKVGKETDSVALLADGWHLRTDVYTSFGVMFGLGVIYLGKYILPDANLQWIDPAAAIAVALLIAKAAYHLTMESVGGLLDISLPESEKDIIRRIITDQTGKVSGFHDLRTRKAGSSRFVEFHLIVNSKITVDDSHEIAETITLLIKKRLAECTVTVHVEPCNDKCTAKCLSGCLIKDTVKSQSKKRGS